jgi:cell division protein ZapA (FtsZ GTPase activity inhibitor)
LKNELNVNVSIADRLYAIKVKPEDKTLVENAVGKINTMVQEYSERYAFKDKQDLLAMAILQYSTLLEKLESGNMSDNKRITDDLLYIDSLLTL